MIMSNAFVYFIVQNVMSVYKFSADRDICGNVLNVLVLFDI